MDCLSKDQLLLLQHNLTYEVYEKFMGLFIQDEILPIDEKEREYYSVENIWADVPKQKFDDERI